MFGTSENAPYSYHHPSKLTALFPRRTKVDLVFGSGLGAS